MIPSSDAAAVKLPCSAAFTNVERCGSSAGPEVTRDSGMGETLAGDCAGGSVPG